jgi:hypothetical protein
MIALKKNDKLIIIIGVVILAVAVAAIALYQEPLTDDDNGIIPNINDKVYEIDWMVQDATLEAISDFASKSDVYETMVSVPHGNLKSVSFNLTWMDDKTFFLGRMGLDTIGLEITSPDGEIIAESQKSARGTKDGNIEIIFDNIVPMPSDTVEADSQMDAEDMLDESPYYDDMWEDEEFTIRVSVAVGEILGNIRPRDKGNSFDLEITYDYYYPVTVSSMNDETKNTGSQFSSGDQTSGEQEYFIATGYNLINYPGYL